MTSCPETMGWEFGDFEKEVCWYSTLGRASPAGGLTVDDVGDSWFVCLNGRQLKLKLKSDHGVLKISTDRDLGGYGMRSTFVGLDSTVSIVKIVCVSLSSCRKTKVEKLINVSYLNNRESSVFRISLHLYICIVTIQHCYSPAVRIEPATSRWLSPKKLGEPTLYNRYAMCPVGQFKENFRDL